MKIKAKVKTEELVSKISSMCEIIGTSLKSDTYVIMKKSKKNQIKLLGTGKNEEYVTTVIKCDELEMEGETLVEIGPLSERLNYYQGKAINISSNENGKILFKGTRFQVTANTKEDESGEENLEENLRFRNIKISKLDVESNGKINISKEYFYAIDKVAKINPYMAVLEDGEESLRFDVFASRNAVQVSSIDIDSASSLLVKSKVLGTPKEYENDTFSFELGVNAIMMAKNIACKQKNEKEDEEESVTISTGKHGTSFTIGDTTFVTTNANNNIRYLDSLFDIVPDWKVIVDMKDLKAPMGLMNKIIAESKIKKIREDDRPEFIFNPKELLIEIGYSEPGEEKSEKNKMALKYTNPKVSKKVAVLKNEFKTKVSNKSFNNAMKMVETESGLLGYVKQVNQKGDLVNEFMSFEEINGERGIMKYLIKIGKGANKVKKEDKKDNKKTQKDKGSKKSSKDKGSKKSSKKTK